MVGTKKQPPSGFLLIWQENNARNFKKLMGARQTDKFYIHFAYSNHSLNSICRVFDFSNFVVAFKQQKFSKTAIIEQVSGIVMV